MDKVHPVTGLGKGQDHPAVERRFFGASGEPGAEQQKDAHGGHHNGQAAESDGRFPGHGSGQRAGEREPVGSIGEAAEQAADNGGETQQEKRTAGQFEPAPVSHKATKVQAQQQVAKEAAHIVKQAEGVPGGLTPQREQGLGGQAVGRLDKRSLSPGRLADEGEKRRKQPDSQIHLQLFQGHFLRPGREEGHNEVHPHQHIHKPEVTGRIIEVEQQALEILHRISESQRIHHRPDNHRNQDAHGPAAEKLSGGIVQRELQIGRCHQENRHAAAADTLKDSHPEGIRGRQDESSLTPQIKGFRAMDNHHHQAGRYPQKIQPDFSFHNM